MKIAVISDIHANLVALEAVLHDISSIGSVEQVVCLGDIVDLGPKPSETLERVREVCSTVIRGNHDRLDSNPGFPFLRDLEVYTRESLTYEERGWLRELPSEVAIELCGCRIRAVHGSPRSDEEGITELTPIKLLDGWIEGYDVLLAGHTHKQLLRRIRDKSVVGVGSTGMPFAAADNGAPPVVLPWAEYTVLRCHNGRICVEFRRASVDISALEASVRSSGMPHKEQWLAHLRN